MKKIYIIATLMLLSVNVFASSFGSSLFADHKSYTVGDIITVIITEKSSASTSANSSTAKDFSHGFSTQPGTGPLKFIPISSLSTSAKNSSSGNGKTSRDGSLNAKMTAKIIKVENNGNLRIKGEKVVNINGEKEITTLEGIVRSQDIFSNNTVYSYNIADAKISYTGKGPIHDASKVGLITRLFNYLF